MPILHFRCQRGHRFSTFVSNPLQRVECSACRSDDEWELRRRNEGSTTSLIIPTTDYGSFSPSPSPSPAPDTFTSGGGGDFGGGGATSSWDSSSSSSDSGTCSSSDLSSSSSSD